MLARAPHFRSLAAAPLLLAACGGTPAPAPETPAASPSTASAPIAAASTEAPKPTAAEPETPTFPTACSDGAKDLCVPDEPFVKRVCALQATEVAFALFAKGSPWTRGYMTRDADAWYASGGASARGKLLFDEEVVIVRKRAAGGIVQGQGGGFDVVRWDGSCASLQSEEVTTKKPPKAKHPPIGWKNLDSKARDALLADAKLSAMYDKRRKECKGATTGDVSLACVKADAALDDGIIDFVRNGGTVPLPKLPK